jgi:pimeloyl-ACP methyl ester carboxylesterase
MESQCAATGEKKTIMWLKDFLPTDLPKARILAFDYPSQWAGDPDYTNLKACGKSLLDEIVRDRKNSTVRLQVYVGHPLIIGQVRRSLVFIGHSFGGLVIKQVRILVSFDHL